MKHSELYKKIEVHEVCIDPDVIKRVQKYIMNLVSSNTVFVTLIQFVLKQPRIVGATLAPGSALTDTVLKKRNGKFSLECLMALLDSREHMKSFYEDIVVMTIYDLFYNNAPFSISVQTVAELEDYTSPFRGFKKDANYQNLIDALADKLKQTTYQPWYTETDLDMLNLKDIKAKSDILNTVQDIDLFIKDRMFANMLAAYTTMITIYTGTDSFAYKRQSDKISNEARKLKAKADDIHEQFGEMQAKIKELTDENHKLRTQIESTSVDNYTSKIATQSNDLAAKQLQIDKLTRKVQELQSIVTNLELDNTILTEEIEQLRNAESSMLDITTSSEFYNKRYLFVASYPEKINALQEYFPNMEMTDNPRPDKAWINNHDAVILLTAYCKHKLTFAYDNANIPLLRIAGSNAQNIVRNMLNMLGGK